MQSLTPLSAAQELLARRRAKTSLAAYIDYLDIGITPARHHRLLIGELEAVEFPIMLRPAGADPTKPSALSVPAWSEAAVSWDSGL